MRHLISRKKAEAPTARRPRLGTAAEVEGERGGGRGGGKG